MGHQIERRQEFHFFNPVVDRLRLRDFAQDRLPLRRRRVPVCVEFFDGARGYVVVLLLQETKGNAKHKEPGMKCSAIPDFLSVSCGKE